MSRCCKCALSTRRFTPFSHLSPEGRVVEPAVDLAGKEEVHLVREGLDEARDEALNKLRLLALSSVEGVIPA